MSDVLPDITVPGAPLPTTLQVSLSAAIANPSIDLGASDSFVTFVTIRGLTIQILNSSEQDPIEDGARDSFDFLTGIDVSIRAEFAGRTNELLIATLPDGDTQFGTAARSLELTFVNGNIDILDFLDAPGGYDVVLTLAGTVPPDNIVISGAVRYRVGLGVAL
jgi:hypothetical protein